MTDRPSEQQQDGADDDLATLFTNRVREIVEPLRLELLYHKIQLRVLIEALATSGVLPFSAFTEHYVEAVKRDADVLRETISPSDSSDANIEAELAKAHSTWAAAEHERLNGLLGQSEVQKANATMAAYQASVNTAGSRESGSIGHGTPSEPTS